MSFSGAKIAAVIVVVFVLVIGVGFLYLSYPDDSPDNADNADNSDHNGSGGRDTSVTRYTINVVNSEGGNATGAGIFVAGNTVVLTAISYDGYSFDGWYKNGSLYSKSSTLNFKAQESLTLTPKFTRSNHDVRISINYPNAGAISSSGGQIAHGNSFTCSVITNSSAYTFDGWYA